MREDPRPLEPRALRSIAVLGLIVAILELAGCGWTPPTGSITGTVQFDGKAVPSGRITVLCEGGKKPVFFAVITNGGYSVQGAPVGAARVTVQAFAAQPPTDLAPTLPGNAPSLPIPANVPRIGRPVSGFPERYLNPNTSGLRCEIKPGPQTLNFDLEP
jgi:hypothetical protein